jgi:hypothetical protein
MNLAKHNKVEADIIAALTKVSKKHNIMFEAKGGTYIPSGNQPDIFRIAAVENTTSGAPRDLAREAFVKFADSFGSPKKEWLDKTFHNGKHGYTIVGYAPNKRHGIVTKRDDGKPFFWTVSSVEQHMKVAA